MSWVEDVVKWLGNTGLGIVIFGAFVVLAYKIASTIKKIRRARKGYWQENMIRKISRSLDGGEFLQILLIIRDLLRIIPAEDLVNLVIEFKDKYDLQHEIEDSMLDLKSLLKFEKAVISKPIHEILTEYRRKKEIAPMINKKKWNKLKKDPVIRHVAEGLFSHYKFLRKISADEARRKGRVRELENKIKALVEEENVHINKNKRHAIERINEKIREEEDRERKKKMREDLFDLFSG